MPGTAPKPFTRLGRSLLAVLFLFVVSNVAVSVVCSPNRSDQPSICSVRQWSTFVASAVPSIGRTLQALEERGEHKWAMAVATTYSFAWTSAAAALITMTIVYIGFLRSVTYEDRKALRACGENEKNYQTPDERDARRIGPRLAWTIGFVACWAISIQFFVEDESSFFIAGIFRLNIILSGFLLFFAAYLGFLARDKALNGRTVLTS